MDGTTGSLRFNSTRDIVGYMLHQMEQALGVSWLAGVASPIVESNQEKENYRAIGTSPAMRRKLGGLKPVQPRSDGFEILNEAYEASVAIPKEWWRREKTGQIVQMIDGLAIRDAEHWGKLASNKISVGDAATSLAYDGQPFYSATHSSGKSGAQSNSITSDVTTPSAPTTSEMANAIIKGTIEFLNLKDDQGEPANEDSGSFLVHVPIGLAQAAKLAARQNRLETSGDNPLLDIGYSVDVYADPRLTIAGWTDKFAIHRVGARTFPIIRQEEIGSREVIVLDENSDHYKKESEFIFGVESSRGSDYGDWTKSMLVTLV